MRILARADARDGVTVRCPDTDTTAIPTRWELTLGPTLEVTCDDQYVGAEHVDGQGAAMLTRRAGDLLATYW